MPINVAHILLKSLIQVVSPFLYVLLLIIGVVIIYLAYHYYRLSKSQIFDIDKMTGKEFEDRLAILFRHLGYSVRVVGNQTGDYGVDLVIEKDGIKTAVQAKCYKRSLVGEDAIREVYTGKNYYQCNEALVVTNNSYSNMARNLAHANNVKLWDRNDLVKWLLVERNINS